MSRGNPNPSSLGNRQGGHLLARPEFFGQMLQHRRGRNHLTNAADGLKPPITQERKTDPEIVPLPYRLVCMLRVG